MFPSINKGILRQYVVTVIVNIGLLIGGTAIGWPNPVIPQLIGVNPPYPITRVEISWAVSLIHVSYVISSIPSGYVMDRFGRKNSLLLLSLFPLSAWLLIVFTKSALMLCISRLLLGVWLGCIYTIVPIYVAEISEPQIRGSLGNFTSLMTNAGTLAVYVIGSFVSYYTLSIICSIMPVVFILTFLWMPESPYYHLMHKRYEKAKTTLMWLRDGEENEIEEELTRISQAVELEMQNKGTVKDLFATRGNRKALLITEVLSLNQKFSGTTALIAYASVTLPSGVFPSIGTNGCVIMLGAIYVVTGVGLMFFIDRIGRKVLLFLSCLGCGTTMLILTVWYYLNDKTTIDVSMYKYVPFLCLAVHGFSYSLALAPIVNNIKGELFPSNVKAVGSVLNTLVLAFSSFLINKLYLIVADSWGFYVDFAIFTVVTLLGAVFSLVVVVETRGKTLQDIQVELNGGKIQKDKNELKC